MRDWLVHIRRNEHASLQTQIREALVSAILDGQLTREEPIPSTRKMAKSLGVSRNTVVLAYQGLLDDGYLVGPRALRLLRRREGAGNRRPAPNPKQKPRPRARHRLVEAAQDRAGGPGQSSRSRWTGRPMPIPSSTARWITTCSRWPNGAIAPGRHWARNGSARGPTTPGPLTIRCWSSRSAAASCRAAASWPMTTKSW